MRFESTANVLPKCKLKYYRNSKCPAAPLLPPPESVNREADLSLLPLYAIWEYCQSACLSNTESQSAPATGPSKLVAPLEATYIAAACPPPPPSPHFVSQGCHHLNLALMEFQALL